MSKIEDYINEATSRLRGDTEIQIEVQHELRSHIEASIEDTTEGESADEAKERALEEMGSAELIKEDLLETHASSMKWKGRLFFIAQAITIPILMIVMSWSLWSDSLIQWVKIGPILNHKYPFYPMHSEVELIEIGLDESIDKWRKEQTEVSFYQMYSSTQWNKKNSHGLKKEIELAQQLYPNNAWLDYVSVSYIEKYEMQGVNMELELEDEKVRTKYEELWNNEKVQECLVILKEATKKTEYKSYAVSTAHHFREKVETNLSTKTYFSYLTNVVRSTLNIILI